MFCFLSPTTHTQGWTPKARQQSLKARIEVWGKQRIEHETQYRTNGGKWFAFDPSVRGNPALDRTMAALMAQDFEGARNMPLVSIDQLFAQAEDAAHKCERLLRVHCPDVCEAVPAELEAQLRDMETFEYTLWQRLRSHRATFEELLRIQVEMATANTLYGRALFMRNDCCGRVDISALARDQGLLRWLQTLPDVRLAAQAGMTLHQTIEHLFLDTNEPVDAPLGW